MSSTTTTASEDRSATRRRFLESLIASGGRRGPEADHEGIERFAGVPQEHEALVETAGLMELTDRVLLRVEGRRPTDMLNGLLTNDAAAAAAESRAVYSFLLTSKGRPVADLRAIPSPAEEEAFWLDLPPGAVEGVESHFSKYLPPRFAEHRRAPGVFVLGLVGPEAGAVLTGVTSDLEPEELLPLGTARTELAGSEAVVVRREGVAGPGFDLYVQGSALRATWDALAPAVDARGGRPVGHRAWEILRVERGIPEFGREITGEVLPQETGQEERAISFEKGCYTGQEVVVRIQHRGKVNRHLRGLAFPDSAAGAPPVGTELRRDDRSVGRITSAAVSPRFGAIAMGYVRREVDPGETVRLAPEAGSEAGDGGESGETGGDPPRSARVVDLPFTEQ